MNKGDLDIKIHVPKHIQNEYFQMLHNLYEDYNLKVTNIEEGEKPSINFTYLKDDTPLYLCINVNYKLKNVLNKISYNTREHDKDIETHMYYLGDPTLEEELCEVRVLNQGSATNEDVAHIINFFTSTITDVYNNPNKYYEDHINYLRSKYPNINLAFEGDRYMAYDNDGPISDWVEYDKDKESFDEFVKKLFKGYE